MLVLIYDDFRANNGATLREVLRFLGVDADRRLEAIRANPTVDVRSQRLHHVVHAVTVGQGPFSRAAKASIKAIAPRRVRRGALHAAQRRLVFVEPEPPDEALVAQLRRRFKGEVRALSEHLGRDLVAEWGYADVA
jgi:hypothetical protein